MKMSVSNIAWDAEHNEEIFNFLTENGFSAIEIAPTKIVSAPPYDHIIEAKEFARELKKKHGLGISSMQSIWFGRTERLFGTPAEREFLLEYTKRAIDFASAVKCGNLVFGCPKNRKKSNSDEKTAIDFYKAIGLYSIDRKTVFSIEPNPEIYGTDYINSTYQAEKLVREVSCDRVKINLDFGTIKQNGENVETIPVELVNHVHISEPFLAPIEKNREHEKLARLLFDKNYNGYVSLEMKDCGDLNVLKRCIKYVKDVFA